MSHGQPTILSACCPCAFHTVPPTRLLLALNEATEWKWPVCQDSFPALVGGQPTFWSSCCPAHVGRQPTIWSACCPAFVGRSTDHLVSMLSRARRQTADYLVSMLSSARRRTTDHLVGMLSRARRQTTDHLVSMSNAHFITLITSYFKQASGTCICTIIVDHCTRTPSVSR
jgi:hypothetical protein